MFPLIQLPKKLLGWGSRRKLQHQVGVSINSTSEEVIGISTRKGISVQPVEFPLIQLPKKLLGDQLQRHRNNHLVSINSTSEEVIGISQAYDYEIRVLQFPLIQLPKKLLG